MSLKNRKKIYLSLDSNLLSFVEEKSNELKINRTKYISDLLHKEYSRSQKEKVDKIIEGGNNDI